MSPFAFLRARNRASYFAAVVFGLAGFVSIAAPLIIRKVSAARAGSQALLQSRPAQTQFAANYGKLPLSFEKNAGQVGRDVEFLSRGPGYDLFLMGTRAVLSLRKPKPIAANSQLSSARETQTELASLLYLEMLGANRTMLAPLSFSTITIFSIANPIQSGLDFWTNQITSCGPDVQCTEVRRIDVSASFFLSIEFQQSGYLVERFYRTAYGNATGTSTFGSNHQLAVPIVRFDEFLRDTQRIGQGVIVLQPGWEQVLENNKQAYAVEFVVTSRFVNAFPASMTPTAFVDKLNQNAGNALSLSERTAAIGLFGGASSTSNLSARAQAMRMVAEDTDLFNAEYNRAFVLAQYFGYLRRNPNDPQDTDYTGYDFWLTKLNQFNGNYNQAEMVKAFLSSIEYRQRFGS